MLINRDEILQLIIDRYTAAEIVDIINLSAEELLDSIGDIVYNNLTSFDDLIEELGYGQEELEEQEDI